MNAHSFCAVQTKEEWAVLSLQPPAMFGFTASAACDFCRGGGLYWHFFFPVDTSGQDVSMDSATTLLPGS